MAWRSSLKLIPSGEQWNGGMRRLARCSTEPVMVKWEGAHLLSLDPWWYPNISNLSSCKNIHYFTNFHFTLKPVQVILSHTTVVFVKKWSELQKSMPNTITQWECKLTSTGPWMLTGCKILLGEFIVLWQQQKQKNPAQLSVTSVTFVRHWPLITFLLLGNAASKPLFSLCSPINWCFRFLPLSASDLWGKCSPLCLLHMVAFILKISILCQLPRAFTFCIPVHHVEYKQGTTPYVNGRSGCTPNV